MAEKIHSSIGASSASRWFACPGSPRMIAQAPPEAPSVYADRGTAAHWVAEECLKHPDDPQNFLGEVYETEHHEIQIDQEDIDAVAIYLDFLEALERQYSLKWIVHSEVKFHIKEIHPLLFGTSDRVMMTSDCKKLKVIDYKHGAGVPVEAIGNKQLLYYALGAISWMEKKHSMQLLYMMGWGGVFEEVELIVCQPRCRHKDGPIRRWVPTANEIDDFAQELQSRAKATEAVDAPLHAGDHCRWCPARPMCPEFSRLTGEITKSDFSVVTKNTISLPAIELLSIEDRTRIKDLSNAIKNWLEAVGSSLEKELLEGRKVPGYKLVKRRSNRKWQDEAKTRNELGLYLPIEEVTTLKSPAQIEKAFKANNLKIKLEAEVYQPDTGLTMAPEHDKREAESVDPKDDFTPEKKG